MKTQGEIEAEISKGINQIYVGLLGRGPTNTRTHAIGSTILVMLQNTLTATETNVAKTTDGRRIIKEMCSAVVDSNRAQFKAAVIQATQKDVIDMHHDISISTGREIIVFSLTDAPAYRKTNGK